VLTIFTPALAPKTEESQRELSAKGVVFDLPIPCAKAEIKQIVGPDGRITLDGVGTIYVAGMTTEEAQLAIIKQIYESKPEASRAAFAVFVDVLAKNGQQAYVVLQGCDGCDNVWQVPASEESTVRNVIEKTAWPHPIDFASATIWISRRGAEGQETLLPVSWNADHGQPTCETNHAVLPGDRVFVKLSIESPPLPVPPPPLAVTEFPVLPYPVPYPAQIPQVEPQSHNPIAIVPPAAPPVIRYSAIPAAAPSPFSTPPSVLHAFPAAIVPQPRTAPVPAQQPPIPQIAAAPQVDAKSSSRDGNQIEFKIAVVEDTSGSFTEFPKLRDGVMMVSDSEATLGAVRILEKQRLVKRLSNPQIKCAIGEQATFCLTSVPKAGKESNDADSLSIQVKAHTAKSSGDERQITIETGFQATRGQQIRQLQIAFQIEEGQTAILKTSHEPRQSSKADGEQAVYVVVTPKVVK
jgi:hypothetical protein